MSKPGGSSTESVHSGEQRQAQKLLIDFLKQYIGQQMERYPGARVAGYSPTQSLLYNAVRGTPVQTFQYGGVVNQPTIGLLGEAGPEAVVPLRRRRNPWGNWGQNWGGNWWNQQQAPTPAPTVPGVTPEAQITGGAQGPWGAAGTAVAENPLEPIFSQYYNALTGMLGGATPAAQNYFQTSYLDPMMEAWKTEMLPGLMQSQATAGTIGTGGAQQQRQDLSESLMKELAQVGAGLQYQQQQLALPQVLGLGQYVQGLGAEERAMQQQVLDTQFQQWLQSLPYNHPALQMLLQAAFNQTYVPTTGGQKGKL